MSYSDYLHNFPPVRPAPVHRGRLTDLAYDRLKEGIDSGEFPPGSVIKEADLVMRFNMSRTPVREAVQRLLTEGYIQQLHRGFVVVELSDLELGNVYRVRGVLEGMAARQAAAYATRVDVALLKDVHDQELKAAREQATPQVLGQLSDAFHDALARASHNEFLQSVLELTRRRAEPYRRRLLHQPGLNEHILADHAEIITAIEAGDSSRAEVAARVHTRHTLFALLGDDLSGVEMNQEELESVQRQVDMVQPSPQVRENFRQARQARALGDLRLSQPGDSAQPRA